MNCNGSDRVWVKEVVRVFWGVFREGGVCFVSFSCTAATKTTQKASFSTERDTHTPPQLQPYTSSTRVGFFLYCSLYCFFPAGAGPTFPPPLLRQRRTRGGNCFSKAKDSLACSFFFFFTPHAKISPTTTILRYMLRCGGVIFLLFFSVFISQNLLPVADVLAGRKKTGSQTAVRQIKKRKEEGKIGYWGPPSRTHTRTHVLFLFGVSLKEPSLFSRGTWLSYVCFCFVF